MDLVVTDPKPLMCEAVIRAFMANDDPGSSEIVDSILNGLADRGWAVVQVEPVP